ncbi:MAG TPA: hypothetical protein VFJ74_14185 [Gemmatimonadaceae bacterium]|nr:hypothetical protein [Gemmatimonadaceae bacterium]
MPTSTLARTARPTLAALAAFATFLAGLVTCPATAHATPAPAARAVASDEPDPEVLAYTVSVGGDSARAALRAAIAASGLGVRAPGRGVVVEPARPVQGIWLDPLELEWMERGYARGITVRLGDLAKVLARGEPRFGRVPFAATVMADLRADTASEVPTRRFFARFVLALGEVRAAGDGQDEATPPDSIELDAVQLAFITRRLHADVALMVPGGVEKLKRAGPRTGRLPSPEGTTRLGLVEPGVRQSGPRADGELTAPLAWSTEASATPCTLTDTEATVLDYAATAYGFGFGKVADLMGGRMASYASAVGVASILASYAKLALMFTFLEAKWEPEGQDVLVRTKSMTTPGERKTLTVQLTYDIKDLQMVNCVRTAFNTVGFDFSMPNGGAISDAEVDFSTMEGQTSAQYDVWWHSQGFEPGYVEMAGNPLGVPTDAGGRARVTIQGMKQREKVAASAEPFDRPASMQARARMTRNDLVKELPSAVGVVSSGGLTVLVSMIPELITRSAIPISTHHFTVRDWASGYRVKLTAEDRMWGTAVDNPETCPGVARDGSDVIEGFIPVKSGKFVESPDAERRTSMPICDIKPVFERSKTYSGWEGKFCSARLTGTQRLSVEVDDDSDGEQGRGVRVSWRLVPRSGQAQVTGDCLLTRFAGPVAPDHEFMTQITRDEYRRGYLGEKDGGGPPGIAGGSVFIPASAMKGKGDTITASDGGWRIELRMVGLK